MSIVDLIKNLTVSLSPTWSKKAGDNSNVVKQKINKNSGNIAGRDIYVNQAKNVKRKALPYVYTDGSFGGNGVVMGFRACRTFNLSDQFVFIDKIKFLDATIPFDNTSIIKAGESLSHTGIDGLSYPVSNDPQYLEIHFHSRNNEQFIAKQQLKFQRREGDGKYNIIGLSESVVSREKAGIRK